MGNKSFSGLFICDMFTKTETVLQKKDKITPIIKMTHALSVTPITVTLSDEEAVRG